MSTMKTEWVRGDKAELARRCGVSRFHLTNILKRRKRAAWATAMTLETEARGMGYYLPSFDLMCPANTTNPLFG